MVLISSSAILTLEPVVTSGTYSLEPVVTRALIPEKSTLGSYTSTYILLHICAQTDFRWETHNII